jgi:hypothetical protein
LKPRRLRRPKKKNISGRIRTEQPKKNANRKLGVMQGVSSTEGVVVKNVKNVREVKVS